MSLTEKQQQEFDRNGYLILPSLFSTEEIALLRAQLPHLFSDNDPANIREKDGGAVRTAMGLHQRNLIFNILSRDGWDCSYMLRDIHMSFLAASNSVLPSLELWRPSRFYC